MGVRSRAWFSASFNPKLLLTQNRRKLGSVVSWTWVQSRAKFQMKHKVPNLHGANQRKRWHQCRQSEQPSFTDIHTAFSCPQRANAALYRLFALYLVPKTSERGYEGRKNCYQFWWQMCPWAIAPRPHVEDTGAKLRRALLRIPIMGTKATLQAWVNSLSLQRKQLNFSSWGGERSLLLLSLLTTQARGLLFPEDFLCDYATIAKPVTSLLTSSSTFMHSGTMQRLKQCSEWVRMPELPLDAFCDSALAPPRDVRQDRYPTKSRPSLACLRSATKPLHR